MKRDLVGGLQLHSVELISGLPRTNITLPNLPKEITKDCGSMFIHDGTLMVFGSTSKKNDYDYKTPSKCFQLENGIWKEHSTLNRQRVYSATVATDKGTFVFGGIRYGKSYEYLQIGSN